MGWVVDDGWLSLSPSSINVIADCGRCGWRAMRGVPRPRGIFPSLPSGIDLVMKHELDRHRGQGEWPPLLRSQNVPGKPLPRPPRTKLAFEDAGNKIRLVGMLDDAFELDGRVGPLDFKTRGSKADEPHPAYVRQMNLYQVLLRANGWTPADFAVLLYLFPTPGAVEGGIPFGVDAKRIDTSEAEGLRVLLKAAAVVRGPMPSPSSKCEYCRWLKSANHMEGSHVA
jgi:hypothetical protein